MNSIVARMKEFIILKIRVTLTRMQYYNMIFFIFDVMSLSFVFNKIIYKINFQEIKKKHIM